MAQEWLSVKQVAGLKRVSWQAVYRAIKDGRLAATRIGNLTVVRREDALAWQPRAKEEEGR